MKKTKAALLLTASMLSAMVTGCGKDKPEEKEFYYYEDMLNKNSGFENYKLMMDYLNIPQEILDKEEINSLLKHIIPYFVNHEISGVHFSNEVSVNDNGQKTTNGCLVSFKNSDEDISIEYKNNIYEKNIDISFLQFNRDPNEINLAERYEYTFDENNELNGTSYSYNNEESYYDYSLDTKLDNNEYNVSQYLDYVIDEDYPLSPELRMSLESGSQDKYVLKFKYLGLYAFETVSEEEQEINITKAEYDVLDNILADSLIKAKSNSNYNFATFATENESILKEYINRINDIGVRNKILDDLHYEKDNIKIIK